MRGPPAVIVDIAAVQDIDLAEKTVTGASAACIIGVIEIR